MMSIGAPLFQKASNDDPGFQLLKYGEPDQLVKVLQNWNRLNYIGKKQFDLLIKMLCIDEEKRICIDDIIKHEWIKKLFLFQHTPPKIIASKTITVDQMSQSICASVQSMNE